MLLGLGVLGLKEHLRGLLPSQRLMDGAGAGAGRGDLDPAVAGVGQKGASASQSSSVNARSSLSSRLRGAPQPRARGSYWALCSLQKQPVLLLTDVK